MSTNSNSPVNLDLLEVAADALAAFNRDLGPVSTSAVRILMPDERAALGLPSSSAAPVGAPSLRVVTDTDGAL